MQNIRYYLLKRLHGRWSWTLVDVQGRSRTGTAATFGEAARAAEGALRELQVAPRG